MTNGLLIAAVIVLAFVATGAAWQLYVTRRSLAGVPLGDDELYGTLRSVRRDLDAVAAAADDLLSRIDSVEAIVPTALRHTGVVAYDAYGDITGLLSRSVALLDDRGSGLVITLLVARDDTRLFVKRVVNGTGAEALSPEENAAVRSALQG